MDNLAESIKDVVSIVEQFYILKSEDITKKLENIRRINLDSLINLMEIEVQKDNIKSKKDIIRYIESIILD